MRYLAYVILVIIIIFLLFLLVRERRKNIAKAIVEKEVISTEQLQENSQELLRQTVEALASAIDAKDAYTRGHSARVAKYAKTIAHLAGLSEEECEEVYLSGLLHDTGKIGIDDLIINKEGKLTKEEFEIIKQHPVLGYQILSNITIMSSLAIGAKYHHERYDGTGYPEGLKGEEIPRIARIIAVADAYDAMTSKRSYRDQIPQQKVREEIVKGIKTQFDPEYAKLMMHMIDMDSEYRMRENCEDDVFGDQYFFNFEELKSQFSAGLRITDRIATIKIRYKSFRDDKKCVPTLLLYDSLDEHYFVDDENRRKMDFIEYGSVCLDGTAMLEDARDMRQFTSWLEVIRPDDGIMHEATIHLVKQEDHLSVKLDTFDRTIEVIFALPDKSRYVFLALTGQECMMDIMEVMIEEHPVGQQYIPRIAQELDFLNGPEGDIPNLEITGWRSNNSEPMPLKDGGEVTFDSISLPSARRIWHCPIICIFTSDDGKINGPGFKELAAIRLDGEAWSEYSEIKNNTEVTFADEFGDWDSWKAKNKAGVSCTLQFQLGEQEIWTKVEDHGLMIENQTQLPYAVEDVYFFFTGDQCAISNIRIL